MHRNQANQESFAPAVNPEDQLNQELRILNDTKTWLAETLHGSMRTHIEYNFDGQTLICEDGGSADEMFDQSVAEARVMTEWNPSMAFELRRRIIERGELNDMYDMINGNKPNTMVVISDFPEEIKAEGDNIGGYNPDRQQTMMRVITWDANTQKISVVTQSLDKSNRRALEAVGQAIGVEFEEGELLEQRKYLDLDPTWSEKLPDILTEAYDDSMQQQTGVEHHAGIPQEPLKNILNTYEFVETQTELLEWFTAKKLADPVGAEKLRYGVAATAKALHEQALEEQREEENEDFAIGNVLVVNPAKLVSMDTVVRALPLDQQVKYYEQKSAAAGDVFDGCGMSIRADQSVDGGSLLDFGSASGYRRGGRGGSRWESDEDCEFISKKCPECKAENVKTKVTSTHISGSCGCVKKRAQKPTMAIAA